MNKNSNRLPVTAVVLTQDEALNIRRCLEALAPVDDVVVVDSGSADRTVDLAREARPDVRLFTHPFRDFADQRNWALEHAAPRHDWILFVDADEFCEAELFEEIRRLIAAPGACTGAFIAGKNYFLGRWLKHATFYPSYQLRLLKRGQVTFAREGHGQREVQNGSARYLRAGWRHETFSKGVHQWIARHNDYSTAETELLVRLRSEPLRLSEWFARDPITRRRAAKRLAARLPWRTAARFIYAYVLRGGFLDGRPGLTYCLLRAAHDIHIEAKLIERGQKSR